MTDYPDGTLPISIIAYAIATLPVDIKAQTIGNVAIDIATVSHGTIDINIASAVTLNVDITAQTVGNIAIDIAAQTAGNITVDIAAQSFESLNITIGGGLSDVRRGYLVNPDFEEGETGWIFFGEAEVTTPGRTGDYSVKFSGGIGAKRITQSGITPVIDTNKINGFKICQWVMNTADKCVVFVYYADGTNEQTTLTCAAAQTWQEFDVAYTADKFIVGVQVVAPVVQQDDIVIDSIFITRSVDSYVTTIGTVNVDITAQTVGNLGIDIKAQTVGNLNVDIKAQTVSLNVKTTGAEKVAIDITAQTIGNVDVNIAAQATNINVDIKAATAKVGITIAAADVTGNIPIDIKAQTVGNVNVDIAAQTVGNIGIDIKAATAKVGITILATDVTGNIPIDIKAQTVGNISIDIAAATAKVGITVNAADVTGNIPIDIKAQTVGNINIDIAAQTVGNIAVNIAASAVTLNVKTTGAEKVAIDITAQTIGNVDVNIAAQAANINVDIKAQTVDLNIKTSGGVNLVIDKLTQTAYLEDRRTLSNNGTLTVWHYLTGVNRHGKFFPRGCRGFINTIDVYCKDAGAAGGTITVYLSPHPSMGYIASADVTVPAEGGADWRSASFNRMWNYDSLFIFYVGSSSDIQWGADTGTPRDFYSSTDSGATWTHGDYRSHVRVVMKAMTVGDLPVSGTVNTIQTPHISTERLYTGQIVVPAAITTMKTINGSGHVEHLMFRTADKENSHLARIYIYTDGNLAFYWDYKGLNDRGYTATSERIQLLKYTVDGDCVVHTTLKFEFLRELKIAMHAGITADQACVVEGLVNLVR